MQPLISLPLTLLLIYRAHTRSSLTPLGILLAGITALIHALHPWSLPFLLLCTFYLLGTSSTKLHSSQKASLTTLSSGGAPSTPPPRAAAQVLANSATASALVLWHAWALRDADAAETCLPRPATATATTFLVPLAILAHYAAVTADTLSSELGMLSSGRPLLLTTLRRVAPGTNGAVSALGLAAGGVGGAAIGLVAGVLAPFCQGWSVRERASLVGFVAAAGVAGTLLDSVLGAVAQASVVDARTGRVVEGEGGGKVAFKTVKAAGPGLGVGAELQVEGEKGGRKVVAGRDLLSNNGVNFVMTLLVAVGSMGVGGWWFGLG